MGRARPTEGPDGGGDTAGNPAKAEQEPGQLSAGTAGAPDPAFDGELEALRICVKALLPLDLDARSRALRYIEQRLQVADTVEDAIRTLARDFERALKRFDDVAQTQCVADCPCPLSQARLAAQRFINGVRGFDTGDLMLPSGAMATVRGQS